MAASILFCRRPLIDASLHLLIYGMRPTTKAGAAPHLYSPIEGTQSPALDPLAAPGRSSRRGRRDVARLWLTAPSRPVRSRLAQDRTTWPGVPSFFSACEVSCRVRVERAIPYASLERFTPRTSCGPIWVPRPPELAGS